MTAVRAGLFSKLLRLEKVGGRRAFDHANIP